MRVSRLRRAFAVIGLAATTALPLPATIPFAARPAAAQVQLNLRNADITSFIEIVSEATGRRFVVDSDVRGSVTVLAPGELTPDELYEVFLSVLELNRLTIVEGVGADRIVPLSVARELSSGTGAGAPRALRPA